VTRSQPRWVRSPAHEAEQCFHAQLIGAARYSGTDDSWASDEVFSTGESVFELPHQAVGADWRDGLDATQALLRRYVQHGARADVLRKAHAVAVGFVDGDISPVWLATDA
jgi:hypothetical protein